MSGAGCRMHRVTSTPGRRRLIHGRAAVDSIPPPPPIQQQRLVFAKAIAADGLAMLYKPGTNQGTGRWIPLRAAVATGRAFFVKVQTSVLAVDADKDATGDITRQLFAAMTAAQLEPVLLASGPDPGRFHLLCRITDDTTRAVFVMKAKALNLDVRPTIRPPFATHWRGDGISFPLDPVDHEWKEALGRLLTVPRCPRRPLPPDMDRLLRVGR